MIGLAREKPYDSIAVKEILDRADVGKSTFYMHFRGKDELLESSIHEIVRSIQGRPSSSDDAIERVTAFSLPILEHIDGHRRAGGPKMTRDSRVVMHERLREVLTKLIVEDVKAALRGSQSMPRIPANLVARHVASTFVLVLNWWVECEATLTPAAVDAQFRGLVLPTLNHTLEDQPADR